MTNEEIAIAIYNGQKSLTGELYLNNTGFIYQRAKSFYNRNIERCIQSGIEIEDLLDEAFFVIPEAVQAYCQSDKQYKFISFLKYPLLKCFSALTGLRTQTGRKEPLNRAKSLDRLISDTEGITYGDTLEDEKTAETYEDINGYDYFNVLHQEIDKLTEKEQRAVKRHYLNNESLTSIAQSEGISINAIREQKVKALRKLRHNERIKSCYYSDFAYRHVSINEFNTNRTSSVEWAVLKINN